MPLAARITTDRTAANKPPAMQSAPHHPSITPSSSSSTNPVLNRKPACACGGSCPKCQAESAVQPKLRIGSPSDKYAQEADRVTDQVMQIPNFLQQRQHGVRKESPRIGSVEDSTLAAIRRKTTLEAGPVPTAVPRRAPPIVHEVLRGSGVALPLPVRGEMQRRFGADLGAVRVHADTSAARSARAVNAAAYTVGSHVVFGEGRYAPHTISGRRTLAHELTHVLQQRSAAPGAALEIGPAGDAAEREADSVAASMEQGIHGIAPVQIRARSSLQMLRRQRFDAAYESQTGVANGISAGTMRTCPAYTA